LISEKFGTDRVLRDGNIPRYEGLRIDLLPIIILKSRLTAKGRKRGDGSIGCLDRQGGGAHLGQNEGIVPELIGSNRIRHGLAVGEWSYDLSDDRGGKTQNQKHENSKRAHSRMVADIRLLDDQK
jgi:hypothetical protein